MRKLLLAIVISGLTLSQASAQDTTTIAAFGDSLMAGYGLEPEDSFPAQLEAKLTKDGYRVNMINDGIGGDTSSGGVSRLDSVQQQRPDIVIVEFGANDLLRGLPPDQVRRNLETMLSVLHGLGIKLLVIGQKAPLSYGENYVSSFDPIYCDLAKTYGAECYPFYYEGIYDHPDLFQRDGIHPNAKGVTAVLDRIYPYVTRLLKK